MMYILIFYVRLIKSIALDVICNRGSYDKVMGR